MNLFQIFTGNFDRTSIIRNNIDNPLNAKLIRFYPLTFTGHKALRVEVYAYPVGVYSLPWTFWSIL